MIIRILAFCALCVLSFNVLAQQASCLRADGARTVDSTGKEVILRGTNLGNWLVPEGYMFDFKGVNAPTMINQLFTELVGPDSTAAFWAQFLDQYITQEDIRYLKATGVNHIRLPFHYKLFTDEPYLGQVNQGFTYLDRAVEWCRAEGLYVLLDMHCAPGGQTGDNIDDSDGYPFLMTSDIQQQQLADIWTRIAEHYKDDPVIAGYDLLNEPIAHYFEKDRALLERGLQQAYAKTIRAIRAVDQHHLIFLNGSIWSTNFKVFDASLDDNVVYEFHKYWMRPVQEQIADYVDFRDSLRVPIYLGESGENRNSWVDSFRILLDLNDIGYAFWPYKKMRPTSCFRSISEPDSWSVVKTYASSPRSTYAEKRENRPSRVLAQAALNDYLKQLPFGKTVINSGYIQALGFEPE